MIRIRAPKTEDFTEENLVGKSIVDPNGDIIAKCISLFEDDKKKMRMRISIKTDISSDFIVDETIPVSYISNIGEVILLKKSFKIEPIIMADIISFDILDPEKADEKLEAEKTIEKEVEKEIPEKKQEKSIDIKIEHVVVKPTKKLASKSLEETSKKAAKSSTSAKSKQTINEIFNNIMQSTDAESKKTKIDKLVKQINRTKAFRKKAIKYLLQQMQSFDLDIRKSTAEIFNEYVILNFEEAKRYFIDLLKSIYSEPSKEIEEIIIEYLTFIASKANSELVDQKLNEFLNDLIIERKICKTVSFNRIHSLNLRIFMQNYSIQEIICNGYLTKILQEPNNAEDIANSLKDYHAIVIAYSIIRSFEQDEWPSILASKSIQKSFDEHFINSITNIIKHFKNGDIRKLKDTLDPKLGKEISSKIITDMIKFRIDDFLSNVSLLPLDVITSFFQDEKNEVLQIIFELINRNEIKAQVIFIEDKTYISLRED